jgi:hypothetical protein
MNPGKFGRYVSNYDWVAIAIHQRRYVRRRLTLSLQGLTAAGVATTNMLPQLRKFRSVKLARLP